MDLNKSKQGVLSFVGQLRIDVSGRLVRWGDVLNEFQRDFFQALSPALQCLAGRNVPCEFRRFFCEWPKGHAKSTCLAAAILWLVIFSPRKVSCVAAAADRDQARLIKDAVADLWRWLPADVRRELEKHIEVQAYRIYNKHTHSEFDIVSSDALTSHGQRRDFIVCDELVHWKNRELWDSLLSTAAKNPRCVLAAITNSGWQQSEWWPIRENIRTDPRWWFSRLDGPQADWLSADDIAEQERHLPRVVFERLWLNRWTETDGSTALEAADIERAKTLPCAPNGRKRGKLYFTGVDLAVRRDFSAVVTVAKDIGWSEPVERAKPVYSSTTRALFDLDLAEAPLVPVEYRTHPGTGLLELVSVHIWKPKDGRIELEDVERELLMLNERFGLRRVGCDPNQAEYLIQRLQRQRVNVSAVDFTSAAHTEMANALLDSFRERRIAIYPHAQLESDLRSLKIQESTRGYRLTAPRTPEGGHADAGVALALALHLAKDSCVSNLLQRVLVYN